MGKKTPLLHKLRDIGGTLYVFPSSQEDVGLNLQSTTTGVAMSHYALLNIPDLTIQDCLCGSNDTDPLPDCNSALAMSLQNYMMNFETLLTNSSKYNYQAKETVTERCFWHWAKKVGIIKEEDFEKVGDNAYGSAPDTQMSGAKKDCVIKCFGAIDAGNVLSTEFGMYNETYINIPTSYGSGPVYLRQRSDDNMKLSTSYKIDNINHLEGRGEEAQYYSYLQGHERAYYDQATENTQGQDFSAGMDLMVNGGQGYKYMTSDKFDCLEIVKDIPTIQALAQNHYGKDNIIISSYDDVNIDVENHFQHPTSFEFNAILLYYSIYDQDDIIKTSYATNLFGIIFLDGARKVSGSGQFTKFYIPRKTKLKSTPQNFGDSYSFRVNLKTMSVYDNTDAVIQDNTTMSSISAVDFSDVVSNLNRAIDTLNTNVRTTMAIQDKYAQIMSFYANHDAQIQDISHAIESYIHGEHSDYLDTNTMYTNTICPNTLRSDNKTVNFVNVKSQNGKVVEFTEPLISYDENQVHIPTLLVDNMYSYTNYVKDTTASNGTDMKVDVLDNDDENESTSRVFAILDKIFPTQKDKDTSTLSAYNDDLQIFVKTQDEINKVYISSDSNMFVATDDTNLRQYIRGGYIDYMHFVPLLILQIRRLQKEINDLKTNNNLK